MSIEKLVLGNEYTKKKLATIFNESNIEFVSSGISYQEAGIFLWPNLEQNFQNFRYNNVFDLERGTYEWDSQDTQDIDHPKIQELVNNQVPCLLFARMKPDRPYVYCGLITYREYLKHTHNPVHLSFNLLEIDDDPTKPLQDLYEWKPKDWKFKRNEWDYSPKSQPIWRDSKDESYKKSVKKVNDALEIRSMAVVKRNFEDRGYVVKDVHHIPEPYHCDFLCTKGKDIRRVEVKGKKSSEGWKKIKLTYHEVEITKNQGLDYKCDLYILYDIQIMSETVNDEQVYRGVDGKLCVYEDYKPEKPHLRAIEYSFKPQWDNCKFPID